MKKYKLKILLYLIIQLFTIQLFSQQSIVSTVNDINRSGSIYSQKVVVYNNSTYILSQNGNNFEFYDVDNAIGVELPSDIVVKDFKIFDKKIYFCGISSNYGFIAKATINDFFNNNYFSFDNIQESQSLNKIQVYKNSNSEINIACIGTKSTGEAILFHCIDNTSATYDIYQSQNSNELFDDIILKGNYVVTVGRPDNSYQPFFIVRVYDKNNISPVSWNKYDSGTEWKYVNNLIADTIVDNKIVVVGEQTDEDDNDLITVAAFVDIINNSVITQAYGSPKYITTLGEFKNVRDVKYSKTDKKLFIVEEYPHSFSANPPAILTTMASSIIVLDPFMQVGDYYMPNIIYSYINGIDHKFNSITELNPYFFTTVGINSASSNSNVEIWNGEISQIGGNCNVLDSININIMNGNPNSYEPVNLINSNNIQWSSYKNNKINISINLICN